MTAGVRRSQPPEVNDLERKNVFDRDLKPLGRRVRAVSVALAIGIAGVAWAGCGSDTEKNANEARETIERGVEEARQGLKGSRKEVEEGFEKAQKELEKGASKAQKEAQESAAKSVEAGQEALEKAREETKRGLEEIPNTNK